MLWGEGDHGAVLKCELLVGTRLSFRTGRSLVLRLSSSPATKKVQNNLSTRSSRVSTRRAFKNVWSGNWAAAWLICVCVGGGVAPGAFDGGFAWRPQACNPRELVQK